MDENTIEFWKTKYEDLNGQFDEFQKSSREFEAELEHELHKCEDEIKELKARNHRLSVDNESVKQKLGEMNVSTHRQIAALQEECAKVKAVKDEMQKYIRELEQKNDDLERTNRCAMFSLGEFETKLNEALERNAILESELDEKDELAETVQRLRDEARDLKQELAVRQHKSVVHMKDMKNHISQISSELNNHSSMETESSSSQFTTNTSEQLTDPNSVSATSQNYVNTNPPNLNSILNDLNLKQQQQQQLLQANNGDMNNLNSSKINGHFSTNEFTRPISPKTRISALNFIGDALRKVTSVESRFINSRNLMKESNRDRRSATISSVESRLN